MVKERCSIRLYFMIVFFACFLQESHQAPVVINHHFLKTMMPQMRSPLEIRNRHLIQMISDPAFVTISHSVLRLLWEEPLNGSDCLSLCFLNYCIFTAFTVPLPAIVTDTHCDGCHLHWAQKPGSCLSLNCHSSKCAVTLYIRWWPLSPALASLRARPNSAYSSTGGGVWRLLIKFDRKLL